MDENRTITVDDLPVKFQVKYLGCKPARGLWGIKHTRKPVNELVEEAKSTNKSIQLPLVNVEINKEGFKYQIIANKKSSEEWTQFSVESISYGVQDLVYTRLFCMIVVKDVDLKEGIPFVCHAFACQSKMQARQLTYALAAAFQHYGQSVKQSNGKLTTQTRFAIDLRTAEEIEEDDDGETEA